MSIKKEGKKLELTRQIYSLGHEIGITSIKSKLKKNMKSNS
jgi:hypothetical protein